MIKLPSGVDNQNLINDLRAISWEAAEVLLFYSRILKDSNNKSNFLQNKDINDPVTLADLKVNELIIRSINEKYRNVNWGILSEENVKVAPESSNLDSDSDWLWVLDPLDGTKDFIQDTGNYAMHLALNFRKRPILGLVLIPERDELWISDGKNTWCEKSDGSRLLPNLSKNKRLQEMVLVTSKNHRNETLRKLIKKIDFNKVLIMGSIGCKIASIVRGESDIYICLSLPDSSSPKDWDFASPQAILKAAGGSITNLDNQELVYGSSGFKQGGIIVASNNVENHEKLCSDIKDIIIENQLYPF